MRWNMKIFGFTITRTSKKEQDEKELEVFEKCVNALDNVTRAAKRIIQHYPDIHSVQNVGEVQKNLETLIDIYNKNKFSRPLNAFALTTLIQEMVEIYTKYTTAIADRTKLMVELSRLKDIQGENCDEHLLNVAEERQREIEINISIAAKEYFISLDSIRFTITYDITRIATGVDIIKQYHDTKKYTIPEKDVMYTLRFKKLSRDEINQQLQNIKEEEKK